MATNIFHDPRTSVPKKDSRIISQDFNEQQMGARKSHIPTLPKNDMSLKHVEKK